MKNKKRTLSKKKRKTRNIRKKGGFWPFTSNKTKTNQQGKISGEKYFPYSNQKMIEGQDYKKDSKNDGWFKRATGNSFNKVFFKSRYDEKNKVINTHNDKNREEIIGKLRSIFQNISSMEQNKDYLQNFKQIQDKFNISDNTIVSKVFSQTPITISLYKKYSERINTCAKGYDARNNLKQIIFWGPFQSCIQQLLEEIGIKDIMGKNDPLYQLFYNYFQIYCVEEIVKIRLENEKRLQAQEKIYEEQIKKNKDDEKKKIDDEKNRLLERNPNHFIHKTEEEIQNNEKQSWDNEKFHRFLVLTDEQKKLYRDIEEEVNNEEKYKIPSQEISEIQLDLKRKLADLDIKRKIDEVELTRKFDELRREENDYRTSINYSSRQAITPEQSGIFSMYRDRQTNLEKDRKRLNDQYVSDKLNLEEEAENKELHINPNFYEDRHNQIMRNFQIAQEKYKDIQSRFNSINNQKQIAGKRKKKYTSKKR
jgi:hypothetical protein